MKVALISKNKLKFFDDTFSQPTTGHILSDPWLRYNNMILSWLQCSLSENIIHSILLFDNVHAVWKNLENRFSHGNIFKIYDLHDELTQIHQGSLDVSMFSTKLTSLWEQIDALCPTRDLLLLKDIGFVAEFTPFDPNTKLSFTTGVPLSDAYSIKSIIGRLLYLTNTRHSISFSSQLLSQYISNPFVSYCQTTIEIFRYLKVFPTK